MEKEKKVGDNEDDNNNDDVKVMVVKGVLTKDKMSAIANEE